MRISKLSEVVGLPAPTIKFYIREGILHPGTALSATKSQYDQSHVDRIRLIRACMDVGGLSLAAIREVVQVIDSDQPLPKVFDAAQRAVSPHLSTDEVDPAALATIDHVTSGWSIPPDSPGRLDAARALKALADLGETNLEALLASYAKAALIAAEADLDQVDARPDRAAKAQTVLVGTALGDALLAALRRAAQQHVSASRYGGARAR